MDNKMEKTNNGNGAKKEEAYNLDSKHDLQPGAPAPSKAPDILDEVKAAESATRKIMLIKTLGQLKKMAKDVLELKEKTQALISELGISAEDSKRLIDFINNLSAVKLTESETKAAQDWAKQQVAGKRKDAEEKVEDNLKIFLGTLGNVNGEMFSQRPYNFDHCVRRQEGSGSVPTYQTQLGDAPMFDRGVTICSGDGNELKIEI